MKQEFAHWEEKRKLNHLQFPVPDTDLDQISPPELPIMGIRKL
jgi:hypothetical protein